MTTTPKNLIKATLLAPFLLALVPSGGCGSSRVVQDLPGDAGPAAAGSFGEQSQRCEGAEPNSYVGCDAWPTPVANAVWSVFDFAVIVANANTEPVDVIVERKGEQVATATVAPNGLSKIYLPWVPELKGKDSDACGSALNALTSTVRVEGGAYHLRANRPVTVYQFNALEYAPVGGPPRKDWTSCPGYAQCNGIECFSYTNDASILFPSRALKGVYRITGISSDSGNAYAAITATENGTNVKVRLSATASVLAGGGVPATGPGGLIQLTMNAGDVVELVADRGSADLSGSLVEADKAVQIITGHPCRTVPTDVPACDHLEQSVVPAEALGKRYFVTQPTGPYGGIPGHVVRLYGNVDNTTLTYPQGAPANAPTRLDAGSVVELGLVDKDFEVVGDHEFAVSTFMLGGTAVDTATGAGDPSQSTVVPVEQFRSRYIFLAPDDYDTSFIDVIQPMEATLVLDGAPVASSPTAIGSSGFGIHRIRLGDDANKGAHVLEGSAPVGLQVLGYGKYTSYQYPGGLDLKVIAPPPPK